MLERARVRRALCEQSLAEEMELARGRAPELENLLYLTSSGRGGGGLEGAMAGKAADFANVETAAAAVALIGFTSGTPATPRAPCISTATAWPSPTPSRATSR